MRRHRAVPRGAAPVVLLAALLTAGCLRPADPAAAPTRPPGPASTSTPMPATSSPGGVSASPTASGSATTPRPAFSATPPGGSWAAFSVPRSAWDSWRPVPTDIRDAPEADVRALERRARAVLDREFTLTVETFFGPGELSHRRDHDRLRFGEAQDAAMEVHVEPFRKGDKGKGAFGLAGRAAVYCADEECVRVTGGEDAGDKPHLFNTIVDSALMQAALLVRIQDGSLELFRQARTEGVAVGTATVESPVGRLDCLMAAETTAGLMALEGKAFDIGSTGSPSDWPAATMACLDARGLVVITADMMFPLVAYSAFRPGAAPDSDRYPYPVKAYPSS